MVRVRDFKRNGSAQPNALQLTMDLNGRRGATRDLDNQDNNHEEEHYQKEDGKFCDSGVTWFRQAWTSSLNSEGFHPPMSGYALL